MSDPGPRARKKRELYDLVPALLAVGLSQADIAKILSRSETRISEVVRDLRLGPPPALSFGELCTWLANEHPGLEHRCRYFRESFTSERTAPDRAAA